MSAHPATGILLCGGSARRFQGQDKPLLELRGQTLAEHVLARLEPQVDEVIISANRNVERYQRLGHRVVEDRIVDGGPLAGVSAAARCATHEVLFVCPGDSPFMPGDLFERLQPRLTSAVDAVVPCDGARVQHLFMLLQRRCWPDIDKFLSSGGRSVRDWLQGLNTVCVSVSDPNAFLNINEPGQLDALEQAGNR